MQSAQKNIKVNLHKKTKHNWLTKLFFGFGNLNSILNWGWLFILYLPLLFKNEQFKDFILPSPTTPQIEVASAHLPTELMFIIGVVSVVGTIIITFLMLFLIPKKVVSSGEIVTEKIVENTLPIITHGQKLSPKRRREITARVSRSVLLTLSIIPSVILFIYTPSIGLEKNIVIVISCFLSFWAILNYFIYFLLKYK